MEDDGPVIKEIFIDASPEETFPYLTETDKYLLWMGVAAEIDARPGGNFKVDPNGRDLIEGKVVEVNPPTRIVFTWRWANPESVALAGSSTVEIELVRQGSGTLLRLVHRGLAGTDRKAHATGWSHYLARLEVVARRGDPGPDHLAMLSHRDR